MQGRPALADGAPGDLEGLGQMPAVVSQLAVERAEEKLAQVVVEGVLEADGRAGALGDHQRRHACSGILQVDSNQARTTGPGTKRLRQHCGTDRFRAP